jgi:hypothetical protein
MGVCFGVAVDMCFFDYLELSPSWLSILSNLMKKNRRGAETQRCLLLVREIYRVAAVSNRQEVWSKKHEESLRLWISAVQNFI